MITETENIKSIYMDLNEIPTNISFTKIISSVFIKTTASYVNDYKSNFNISSMDIMPASLIIDKHICENIEVNYLQFPYSISFIVKEIIDYELAYKLIIRICEQLTFCLIEKTCNHHLTVPFFFTEFMNLKIAYGEHRDKCIFNYFNRFCCKVSVEAINSVEMNVNFNNNSLVQVKISKFLNAVTSNELIVTFIRLYDFIEKIRFSVSFKNDLESYKIKYGKKKYPSYLVCDILAKNGITKINGNIDINGITIYEIIKTRDNICHGSICNNLNNVLFNNLLPIVKQIVLNESEIGL